MRYRTVLSQYRGDPGLLSGIGRALGGVARTVGRVLPGPVGAVAAAAGRVLPGGGATRVAVPSFAAGAGQRPAPGVTGAVQRILPGGKSGYLPSRRMNAGNAKAARRAIRRIKAVRKLLQSIDRELPRRPCGHKGSPGRITRAEAARALRS